MFIKRFLKQYFKTVKRKFNLLGLHKSIFSKFINVILFHKLWGILLYTDLKSFLIYGETVVIIHFFEKQVNRQVSK